MFFFFVFFFENTVCLQLLEPGTQHYGIFPSAVAEAMGRFSVDEFSLKMSQGLWDTKSWGYPMVAAPPGAELTGFVLCALCFPFCIVAITYLDTRYPTVSAI